MKKICSCLFAGVLLLSACSSKKTIVNDGKVWAAIYQQRAAEYKALCFQAYNIARLRLDDALKQPSAKPYAVITDLDETLLDNSPYDAQRAINNLDYDGKTWKEWTAKGICDTVPGGPAFFRYAASRGVEVFYITNRDTDERAGTLKNLQLYGLPNVDNKHLILNPSSNPSKETRRQSVRDSYNVILLCGDNLADFDALYDNSPSEPDRIAATRKLIADFGSKYIILPNPAYGDWENALYNFNFKLKDKQKDSIIKARIKLEN